MTGAPPSPTDQPVKIQPVSDLGLPRRVDGLEPFGKELKTGLPRFVVEAFSKQNGGRQVPVPVRLVRLLGKCRTDRYECQNLPSHHLERWQDEPDSLAIMGRYYWFDLELIQGDGTILPLRLVYNEGDADCNDGIWGEFWDRDSFEKVADFHSTSADGTTLTATPAYRARFKNHPISVPTDRDYEGGSFWTLGYRNDDQLERLLHVGLLLAGLQGDEDVDWLPMQVP